MRENVWRASVFVVGAVVDIILIFAADALAQKGQIWATAVYVGGYAIAGGVVGYLYPRKGWRSGGWLVVFFLVLLISSALFVGSPPAWDWSKELKNLTEDAAIVLAALFGSAAGAFIKRQFLKNKAMPSEQL